MIYRLYNLRNNGCYIVGFYNDCSTPKDWLNFKLKRFCNYKEVIDYPHPDINIDFHSSRRNTIRLFRKLMPNEKLYR
jgi:hypothetical protein